MVPLRIFFWLLLFIGWLMPALLCAADAPSEELKKLKELEPPSLKTLLTEDPHDWVVLNNDDVLLVNSLVPRPLTIPLRKEKIAALEDEKRRVFGAAREELDRQVEELKFLVVTLPSGMDRLEFRLPVAQVKQIIHHEDLMLQRFELLLNGGELDQAYELLTRLQRSRPDWAGVDAATEKQLSRNADQQLQQQHPEAALRLLEELHRRNPKAPDLSARMGTAVQQLVEAARKDHQYQRAQFFLHRLQQYDPQQPVYRKFAAELTDLAVEKLKAAESQSDPREAILMAEAAVATWPPAKQLRSTYDRLAPRYPRLHIGVTDLPGECIAYPLASPADERRARLTQLTLFEIDRLRDGTASYQSRFFDEWEPQDLGRKMKFRLRQHRQPFDIQALITAADAVAPLVRRLDPNTNEFDERLAAYIDSVQVHSPAEFTVNFRRVPPRLEPLLAEIPLLPPTSERAATTAGNDPGGWKLLKQTSERCEYVRRIPEAGAKISHLAEIVEHRFDSPEKLVQGLRRGEVSFAADLPDVLLRELQQDEEFLRRFFIQPCAVPLTHVLQFHPDSLPLRSSELRKGLATAIDTERLLTDVVLQDPRRRHGRVISSPFYSGSPARNPSVEPTGFNLSKAFALVFAARQQLQREIPTLTLVVAPESVPESAAEEIAATWRRLGLKIRVVHATDPRPERWDILYRTLRMNEPTLDLWPFLTLQSRARIADLAPFPDWLKQELVTLDRTGNQSRALDSLQQLHRRLMEDAALIPLWEVDQFVILRKNIHGFPPRLIESYESIDHWSLTPWYETELP